MIAYQILRRNVSNFGDGSTKSDPFAQIESSIKVRLMPFFVARLHRVSMEIMFKKWFFFKKIKPVFGSWKNKKYFFIENRKKLLSNCKLVKYIVGTQKYIYYFSGNKDMFYYTLSGHKRYISFFLIVKSSKRIPRHKDILLYIFVR